MALPVTTGPLRCVVCIVVLQQGKRLVGRTYLPHNGGWSRFAPCASLGGRVLVANDAALAITFAAEAAGKSLPLGCWIEEEEEEEKASRRHTATLQGISGGVSRQTYPWVTCYHGQVL